MNRPLAIIVAISIALRVAAALAMGNAVTPLPGIYDQISYTELARRVVDGHGFTFATDSWPATRAGEPTAHWSFLYTGFLALVLAVVGPYPLAARLLQAVLVGLLLPLGLYHLGRRTLGERAGLWAAGLSAVYVYFVYYSAALMTEMFTIVAVLALLAQIINLAERPTRRGWLALGVLIGTTALLRQVAVLPVPILALWLLWRRREPSAVAGLALAAAVAGLMILPITLRNQRVFHRFVPINTNAGYAFFWANHPIHGTRFHDILPADGPSYQDLIPAELLGLDEAALNDALMARGWQFVRDDPVRYVQLSVSRLADYFKFWPSRDSSRLSNVSRVFSFGVLLPFMLAGLWLSRTAWRACLPLYLFAGTYTLLHLLSWALIRYRMPVDAVLLVFAGLACDRAWERLRPRLAAAGLPLPMGASPGPQGGVR